MSPSREVRIESWEFDDLPAVVRGEAVRSLAATTPEMENLNQHNARMEIFREIREIYWTTDVPGQEIIRARSARCAAPIKPTSIALLADGMWQ
jgi:hypothetical protein